VQIFKILKRKGGGKKKKKKKGKLKHRYEINPKEGNKGIIQKEVNTYIMIKT